MFTRSFWRDQRWACHIPPMSILSDETLRWGRLQGGPRGIGFQRYPRFGKAQEQMQQRKNTCWGSILGVITNITCYHGWMMRRFHVSLAIFSSPEFSSCLNLPVRVSILVKHPSYDKVNCSQWLAHAIEATIAPGAPVFDTLNLSHAPAFTCCTVNFKPSTSRSTSPSIPPTVT